MKPFQTYAMSAACGGLIMSVLAVLPALGAVGTGPSFKGPLGLQLYSLRDQFAKDVPGTLDKVRDMGFKEVELAGTYGMSSEAFKAELDKRGLRAVSAFSLRAISR